MKKINCNIHIPSPSQAEFIAGAALGIGGGGACLAIGGTRVLPLATMIAGVGLLLHNAFNQPSQKSKEPNRSVQWTFLKHPWKSLGTLLSVAAIATPLFCYLRIAGCAPKDVLLLQSADPGRSMATQIPNIGAIHRVISDPSTPFYGVRPLSVLQSQISQDWRTVFALGTSHIELADHLKRIFNAAPSCGKIWRKNSWQDKTFWFFYDPNQTENNTIGKSSKTQLLKGCKVKRLYKTQDDLKNETFSTNFAAPYLAFHDFDLKLTNLINGVHMQTGVQFSNHGDLANRQINEITFDNIRKYGFYGVPGSEDRLDPVQFIALLTGQSICALQKAIGQSCQKG